MDKQHSDNSEEISEVLGKISEQLQRQQESLNSLRGKYESLTEDLDRAAITRAINAESIRIEKEQRNHIDVHFQKLTKIIAVVGILLSALGAVVGYIGLDKYVPYMMEERLNERLTEVKESVISDSKREILDKARDELFTPGASYLRAAEGMLTHSMESLRQANLDKRQLGKNDLIVLQTDFGAESPYMGILKGAIYQINERARIDVITEEIPAFRTLDAAWILSRAAELYPENTIFVAITGDPGKSELKAPVIVRTKQPAYTFVGYFNGVFDLVEKKYGVDGAYEVSWEDLRAQWFERGFRVPDPTRTGTAEILGFLAGALSFTEPPWSSEKSSKAGMQNPADIGMEFPWLELATKVKYRSKLAEKDKVAEVAIDTESGHYMLEGTIMHIDRFGNANTNISKQLLDKALADKGWSLGRSAVLAAGVANPDIFGSDDGGHEVFHLKPITFSEQFDPEQKGKPIVTTDSGKLQLAINFGNFAQDNPLRPDYKKGSKDRVPVQTGDKVKILIKPRLPSTFDIICDGESDGFEECKESNQ